MRLPVSLLLILSLGPLSAAEWKPLEQALAQARRDSRPVFVDIMAPWCKFCRKMREQVYPTSEFEEASKGFILARVNADEDPAVRRYVIEGLPTILIMDKNGYVLGRSDGFTETYRLVRLMKDAEGRAGTEDKLARDVREKPGVQSSYEAGLYYASINESQKARAHFLRAWEFGKQSPTPQAFDSLYNAAVSSMELKDYSAAVKLWSDYVDRYPAKDHSFAYARYFRGLSLRKLGKSEQAKPDISYASQNLPSGDDREAAASMAKRQ